MRLAWSKYLSFTSCGTEGEETFLEEALIKIVMVLNREPFVLHQPHQCSMPRKEEGKEEGKEEDTRELKWQMRRRRRMVMM
jgi:hypothetical protein